MALNVGERLLHYDMTALIGEGGMGQVYQATDTKLNRQVALKILPEAFAADPDRLARFEREAKVLASLNHPNIGHIYGLEEAEGTKALVLELIEGPTLEDRIKRGPIPVDEALPIAKEIAEALEAAHEAGVIHRDLKPANIKVREDGTVKVLDFGLAKAVDPTPAGDPDQSPTLTAAATQMGVILGTAAYMSPEQARGKPVDRRADIWAFGCVLYEMLTGGRAFPGDDVTQTLAKVVEREPDWEQLPAGLAGIVDIFMRRCLDKDSRNRVRDIGDARLALTGAFDGRAAQSAAAAGRSPGWHLAAALGIAAIAGAGGWAIRTSDPPRPARVSRAVLSVPPSGAIDISSGTGDIAVAPDGRFVVYPSNGTLHVRYLDRLASVALGSPATAHGPFVSPDGAWVGYATQTLLQRRSIQGGPPVTITDTNIPFGGASWGEDEMIVYALLPAGLFQVPASGGDPERLTVADDVVHAWPDILPGGQGVLFTIVSDAGAQIALLDLEARTHEVIVPNGAYPRYSATGHILYASDGALHVVPFDLDARRVTGEPVVLVEEVLTKIQGVANFDVADGGALVYSTGSQVAPAELSTPVWVDRNGHETPLSLPAARYFSPRVSPDGRRLAVNVDGDGLWVYDLETAAGFLLVRRGVAPIWTPDGERIVYASFAESGFPSVAWIAADGTGDAELLVASDAADVPTGVTPDGSTVVFAQIAGDRREIWEVALDTSRAVRPVLQGNVARGNADVSPDGRWLAYRSNQSGAYEVLLQPYPGPGPTVPVSVGGGDLVIWSADSSEMFYRIEDRVMAVRLSPSGEVGRPSLLFAGNYLSTPQNVRQYHVARDGRFLMLKPTAVGGGAAVGSQVVHVQSWVEELGKQVPTP